MIEDALRAAGIDVDAMREDARAAVDRQTPAGWEAVMIRSPWPDDQCPVCGVVIEPENMGVATLTRRLARPRVLLFTLTIVCDGCVGDSRRLGALAGRTFV